MIKFENVSKAYAGAVAVNDLSLEVNEGEVAVLVGPSGCGKTTTLRLVNRMVEPTGGRIVVDGDDAMALPVHQLRRKIGYVIQHTGLFPHRTIAGNIATVPDLVGWRKQRIRNRVDELMNLVGLAPEMADRYPHQLSGGQRQRVGVARALAVDPPLMLMDEPFGAVDPIVRTRLQDEFQRLQAEMKKTIVFVTHDVDEAIKMGDRIAILNVGGVLEQYATPEELLAKPANDFVANFLGDERSLKRLALMTAAEVELEPAPSVADTDNTTTVLEAATEAGASWVVVLDGHQRIRGILPTPGLIPGTGIDPHSIEPVNVVRPTDSLRKAVEEILASESGIVICADVDERYRGALTRRRISEILR